MDRKQVARVEVWRIDTGQVVGRILNFLLNVTKGIKGFGEEKWLDLIYVLEEFLLTSV